MSRISSLSREQMSPAQRQVHDEILAGPRAGMGGPFHAWLHSPALADRAQKLGQYCRFDSSLPQRLSELAILVTAHHWRAQFEWYAHAPIAAKAGLAPAVIEAIRAGRMPDFAAPEEAAVYALCIELYENQRVSDDTYDRAAVALGEQQVVDLVGVLGYYALVSMTLNVFEMALPDGVEPPFAEHA